MRPRFEICPPRAPAQCREVTYAAQLSGRTGWLGPVIILSTGEPGCRPEPKGSYDQSETDACPGSLRTAILRSRVRG